jgi:eukaryotic-like serine/threonine-protein kinase
MGTPAFMSPEQIRGAKDVDHRTDIWALGITLFQLLTGSVPFYANTYAKLVITITRDPTPEVSHIPPGLNAVLQRCLAKDRTQRYQTIAELAQDLEPFANDRGEATLIVQRCIGLVRAQQVRAGVQPQAPQMQAGPGYPQPAYAAQTGPQPPYGASQPMGLQPQGLQPMNPMATPAQGMQPMHALGTPAQGMPPGHQVNPMVTPAQGMPPSAYPGQPFHDATGPQLPPYAQYPNVPGSHATGPQLPATHATGAQLPATIAAAPTASTGKWLWLVLALLLIGGATVAAIVMR